MQTYRLVSSTLRQSTTVLLKSRSINASFSTKHYFSSCSNMGISYETLKKQNAETSNAIIEHWSSSESFAKLANYEGDLTVTRDQEDADKLQVGIDYAKAKGVIDPDYVPEPYVHLDVLGKTPDQVAKDILDTVAKNSSGNSEINPKPTKIIPVKISQR